MHIKRKRRFLNARLYKGYHRAFEKSATELRACYDYWKMFCFVIQNRLFLKIINSVKISD